VKKSYTEKFENFFLIPKDSDAAFDEESEYAIGLMIRATNDDKSSIFRNYCNFFFAKKNKNF